MRVIDMDAAWVTVWRREEENGVVRFRVCAQGLREYLMWAHGCALRGEAPRRIVMAVCESLNEALAAGREIRAEARIGTEGETND
jgi:hypothetical protein